MVEDGGGTKEGGVEMVYEGHGVLVSFSREREG